jgi:diacylglycerol kinase family enzyme
MKKIRFIINPHSGTGKKEMLPELIQSSIDKSIFNAEICFTKAPGHATELSREAVANGYEIVVAVGGDGSVNETASALINSKTALGIIPTGSGNGLARHLGIPVHAGKAIAVLNSGKIDVIDSLLANDRFCIGTLGVGFDAHIAHLFSISNKRGYLTYIKLVLKEFVSFRVKNEIVLC